jgi:hypothetical protein
MTSAPWSWSPLALRTGVFTALTLTIAACARVHYLYPTNMQGFNLPPGCPSGSAPADTTQLNACLTGIEFDLTETVGDEQRLMVRADTGASTGLPCFGDSTHTCRYGPLAVIQPVKGAEMYSHDALQEGRIIARMYLKQGETESYPKFGLEPGDTTYWWVSTAQDTSQFVRHHSGIAITSATGHGLTLTQHPKGSFQQAAARWVWDPVDERVNGTCGSSCCKP